MTDFNYYSDSRVQGGQRSGTVDGIHFDRIDRARMVGYLDEVDTGKDEYESVAVKLRFEVCPTCDGRGSHVNPSIDCNGLSREDFAEDPDFAEDYFSGMYDVPCYQCGGENVALAVDRSRNSKAVLAVVDEWAKSADESRAEYLAERRMGA